MPFSRVFSLCALVSLGLILSLGCAAETSEEDYDTNLDGLSMSEDDFTAQTSDFKTISTPAGLPSKTHNQPDSEGWFNAQGMCGQTAASNMLLFYGITKPPRELYDEGYRSVIGTLPSEEISIFNEKYPSLGCTLESAPRNAPLQTVYEHLKANKPMVVLVGMSGLNAHWVTLVGGSGFTSTNPSIYAAHWGRYTKIDWQTLKRNWSYGYGGSYPYISCKNPSKYTLPRFAKNP